MTTADQRSSLWRLPAVGSLFAVTVLGFLSYSLLLSALPAYAAGLGAGLTAAGSATTVLLLATVLTQAAVPALVARLGTGVVLGGGRGGVGAARVPPPPGRWGGGGGGWAAGRAVPRGGGFRGADGARV